MAIKSNVNFNGIILNDMYIKINRIINSKPNIEVLLDLYSIVDGNKGELIQKKTMSIEKNEKIIKNTYKELKEQIFQDGIDI